MGGNDGINIAYSYCARKAECVHNFGGENSSSAFSWKIERNVIKIWPVV